MVKMGRFSNFQCQRLAVWTPTRSDACQIRAIDRRESCEILAANSLANSHKKHVLFSSVLEPAKRAHRYPWHGLAHSVHDFGVAGGLRRPYVSVHPRLPDKDKTAHSSHRSRQTGKMLVVLRDGRKLFGVLRSYDQFGTHPSHLPSSFRVHERPKHERLSFFFFTSPLCSQLGFGRYGREDISPRRVCGTMGRSVPHPRRERRLARRDRKCPETPPPVVSRYMYAWRKSISHHVATLLRTLIERTKSY